MILVYGDPKTGKSFWAMDVGWHIAAGQEYRGRKVRQGPVVYIPFEGEGAVINRIEILGQERGIASCWDLVLAPAHPSVSALTVRDTLDALREKGIVPVLTIFDTLAASMVGSENEAEDMQQNYIRHLQRIVRETGSSVMIIHHASKDGRGPRGSTSLPATVDCQIYIRIERRKEQDNIITSRVELMKDGPEGENMDYYLRTRSWMIQTEDGEEEVSSCFLEPLRPEDSLRRKKKKATLASPQTVTALEIAKRLLNGAADISVEEWKEVCLRPQGGIISDPKAKLESVERRFREVKRRLEEDGTIVYTTDAKDRFSINEGV